MPQDYFSQFKEVKPKQDDYFSQFKTAETKVENPVKTKEEIAAEELIAEITSRRNQPQKKSLTDRAWDFGKSILATAYGTDESKLPAIPGVTRAALPLRKDTDMEGWFEGAVPEFLYDNFVQPSSSVVAGATDWLGGKIIGGGIRGVKALRRIGAKVNDIKPNAANPQVANVDGVPTKVVETPEKPLTPPVNIAPKFGQPKVPVNTAPIGTRAYSKQPPSLEQIKEAKLKGYEFVGEVDDKGRFVFTKVSDKPLDVPLLEADVAKARPTKRNIEAGRVGPLADVKKANPVAEAINLPRAIMASNDLSAPLRQGLGLIHKKAFWKAIPSMFKAYGSEDVFRAMQDEIASRPLFQKRVVKELNDNGDEVIKTLPSFADDAGLKLTDLTDLSSREEALMSTWAEKVPGVRRSNRAYTIFLNKLRADTFEDLVKKGQVFGVDSKTNLPLARELANFVNTATGRGDLGKLESSAVALNSMFFSPRLIASRLQMLNPMYYITANPMVRKEALKSLAAITAFGNTIGQLGKLAGGTVEADPASSDFGKLKFGDVRVDPFGGFQQYVVLMNRLSPESINPYGGRMKSSTTGQEYKFSEHKFGRSTKLDVAGRFAEQKLNPIASFVTGMARGKNFRGEPFNLPDEVAQRFMPILMQDLIELATENPELLPGVAQLIKGEDLKPQNLPLAIPSAFGMSVQKYTDRR
jgi:hypothetical protein